MSPPPPNLPRCLVTVATGGGLGCQSGGKKQNKNKNKKNTSTESDRDGKAGKMFREKPTRKRSEATEGQEREVKGEKIQLWKWVMRWKHGKKQWRMDTRKREDTRERFQNEWRNEWSHHTVTLQWAILYIFFFFFGFTHALTLLVLRLRRIDESATLTFSLIHSHALCHEGMGTGDGMQTKEGRLASPPNKSSTGYRCIIQTPHVSCCYDSPTPTCPCWGLTSHVKRCLFKVTLNKLVASLNCHRVDPSFLLCYAAQPKHAEFSLLQQAAWPCFCPQNRALRELHAECLLSSRHNVCAKTPSGVRAQLQDFYKLPSN